MTDPAIVPIVEGQSECESVPVLLRRLLNRRAAHHVRIGKPIRVKRLQVVRASQLERAIELARRTRHDCAAMLVLLDADDDDPDQLRVELQDRADKATDVPVAVVLAVREFEAWFLAAKESLRGTRGIVQHAAAPPAPENIRGAKEALSKNMQDRNYLEIDDQPALTSVFDLETASTRCPSFQRLVSELDRLLTRLPGGNQGG